MHELLKILTLKPEEAIENKSILIKIKRRILRRGYRRLLTNIEWNILNITCIIIKDKIKSPTLKNKIKQIIEKTSQKILNNLERKIIHHISQLRNTYIKLIDNMEGAMKKIYNKLINDWEYLYNKALNIIAGEKIGAYIKY